MGSKSCRDYRIKRNVRIKLFLKSYQQFCSIELGETKKDVLENVYDNKTQNLGLGSMNTFTVVAQIWDWTNKTFSSTPTNTISFSTFYDPEDVQALSEVNGREVSIWDWWFLNTSSVASHMRYLPIPADDYLFDVTWDTGHTVSSITITVKNAIPPLSPDLFITDYTAIFTFDSKFGIYNGFRLLDDEENVIYELESKITVPTKAAILGYELAVFLGITSFAIICLIYIYTKKK